MMGLVVSDDGWRMPDWLWARIEPVLPAPPPHPLGCHRPRVPDRDAMDAILLVLRTGMQWNALNATGICSSSSAHRRFQEWERAGARRRQPPGPAAPRADPRQHPDRTARADERAATGAVPRPRLRLTADA